MLNLDKLFNSISADPILFALWALFILIISSIGVYAYSIKRRSTKFFKKWNSILQQINGLKQTERDHGQAEFDENAKNDPYFNKIITHVKEIVKTSKELSINEIGSLTDDLILSFEHKLNSVSGSFFFVGISFTILGLFVALNTISLPETNVALRSTDEILSSLVKNFQLAFISTIIGVILSAITKFTQFRLSQFREPFQYNLLLYIKNVIIPVHSIPEVEKDLGELVRTLSQSSSSLMETSDQLSDLVRNTQLSTESIVESVETFSDVTEKMGVREEKLTSALSNLSKFLTDLRGGFKEIVAPIDALRNDLIDRDQSIGLQIDFVRRIYDKQMQIDSSITSILGHTRDSVNKIGEFFNENFTPSFKEAMKDLSEEQKGILEEVKFNTETTRGIVESMPDPSVISREMKALGNIFTSTKDKLENNLAALSNSFQVLYNETITINSNVNKRTNYISNRVNEIQKLLSKDSEFRNSIDSDFKLITDKLEKQRNDPNRIIETLNSIEIGINKIIENYGKINSLRKEKIELDEKVKTSSTSKRGFNIPKMFSRGRNR